MLQIMQRWFNCKYLRVKLREGEEIEKVVKGSKRAGSCIRRSQNFPVDVRSLERYEHLKVARWTRSTLAGKEGAVHASPRIAGGLSKKIVRVIPAIVPCPAATSTILVENNALYISPVHRYYVGRGGVKVRAVGVEAYEGRVVEHV